MLTRSNPSRSHIFFMRSPSRLALALVAAAPGLTSIARSVVRDGSVCRPSRLSVQPRVHGQGAQSRRRGREPPRRPPDHAPWCALSSLPCHGLARPLRVGERERLADRCSPQSPSCRPVHAARQPPPGRCRERLPRPRVSQRDDGPHGARQGQRDDHPRASSLARAPFFSGEGSRQANGPRCALQGGGVFGDKAVTLERFKKNYQELSQGVKNRCVLGFLTSAWLASLTCRARAGLELVQPRSRERRDLLQRRRPSPRLRGAQHPARLRCAPLPPRLSLLPHAHADLPNSVCPRFREQTTTTTRSSRRRKRPPSSCPACSRRGSARASSQSSTCPSQGAAQRRSWCVEAAACWLVATHGAA